MEAIALIIGALMVGAGLAMSLVQLKRQGAGAEGTNRFSTAMALVGGGSLVVMLSLLVVW